MIVITGASGMIGSGVVRYLNDLGIDDLLLVDDLKKGEKWKNLVGKQFSDLISKHLLFSWLQSNSSTIEAIIHLGACSDTVEADADYLLENNFHYTVRLAKWALQENVRFIYASSAATYGDGNQGFQDDENALETLRPLNMYGYSKHLVDLWMKRNKALGKVVGLKYFNVFGPNEYHKGRMASMAFKMMQTVKQNEPVRLFKSNDPQYTDGGQMRDFIYVKDAVRMTCAFLNSKLYSIGGIFNIGYGKPTSWNALAKAFFQALEKKEEIEYVEMPSDLKEQYQNYTCAAMDKFYKIFPDFEMTPLSEAVAEYVQCYLMKKARW